MHEFVRFTYFLRLVHAVNRCCASPLATCPVNHSQLPLTPVCRRVCGSLFGYIVPLDRPKAAENRSIGRRRSPTEYMEARTINSHDGMLKPPDLARMACGKRLTKRSCPYFLFLSHEPVLELSTDSFFLWGVHNETERDRD